MMQIQEANISNSEEILNELESNLGSIDKASVEEICSSILVGEPDNYKAHKILFTNSMSASDFEAAEKHAINWIGAIDGFEPRYLLASMLSKAGRDHEALEQFQLALRESTGTEPELFDVFKSMGNSYVRTLDYQSAEELYNRAYALNSESDVLEVNYGTLFIQMNRFIEAVERFKLAIEKNKENQKAWVGIAISYRGLREYDLAYANIQKAFELDVDNQIAMQLLFDWSFQDNRFELLTSLLTEKINRPQMKSVDVILLAKVFAYQEHWIPAKEVLERAITRMSNFSGAEQNEISDLLIFCNDKLAKV